MPLFKTYVIMYSIEPKSFIKNEWKDFFVKVQRAEKHRIKKNNKFYLLIDDFCWKSKNMYNYGNYIIRQEFISTSKLKEEGFAEHANWIQYNALYQICKSSDSYVALGSIAAQATLRKLEKNWKSFFESIKDYQIHPEKYQGRPKIPKYLDKEKGRYELGINNQRCKIKDGYVYFGWKPLRCLNGIFKSKIPDDAKLIQCRFVPKKDEYVLEVVYEISLLNINKKKSQNIAAIDLGVDNLITLTTNCGTQPIVINGKPLKAINQYYNKVISDMRSDLKLRNDMNWSHKMQKITTKRNYKVEDYIHKATKIVIDFLKDNDIDTLVCGYNTGWKQETNIGKINNQNFVYIPHSSIIEKLSYKCENEGILFKTTEEGYTSGTSFLDEEDPCEENYDKSRRKYRGLFISNNGIPINADVNGSYQIMKKVFPTAFKNGVDNAI